MNECRRCGNTMSGNELTDDADHLEAPGKRLCGGDWRSLPLNAPVPSKLVAVWPTLPENIRKVVDALCLQPAF